MGVEKAVEDRKASSILGLIHMSLDSYDDIFSDFDPSPYSERLLSEDFVLEARRRYAERKGGGLELRFSLPAKLRSPKVESLIKRRLKDHFNNKAREGEAEVMKSRMRGAMYFGAGFAVLFFVAFSPDIELLSGLSRFLEVLLVPVGWFGMFGGVDLMVESPRKFEKEMKFNRRLSSATYTFFSEEELVQIIEKAAEKPVEKGADGKDGPVKKAEAAPEKRPE
ncbi:MAG TPA: hypothetical protein PKJ97_04325 [Candidatus Bilamarchaeaceae archaeon]|nr:hypothetical protein [Candidatus Bilamarchaeaceae archaeon]